MLAPLGMSCDPLGSCTATISGDLMPAPNSSCCVALSSRGVRSISVAGASEGPQRQPEYFVQGGSVRSLSLLITSDTCQGWRSLSTSCAFI